MRRLAERGVLLRRGRSSMSATTVKQRQPGDQEDQVAHPHRPGGVDDARLALRHAEHDDGVIDQDDRKKTRQKVGQHLATGLGDGQGRTDQYEDCLLYTSDAADE